jgi:hypothetical protein
MYYIGVYAAVSTCELFRARFPFSSRLSPQITGIGSCLCYGFGQFVSYSLAEKVLSSRLSAGTSSVRIVAPFPDVHNTYLTLDTGSIHASTVLYKSELHLYTHMFCMMSVLL